MFRLDQFSKILAEMLLKHDFQFPITCTMIGIDGHVFAARFELSADPKESKGGFVTGNPKKLRFPINALLVDKGGKAAHVLFKGSCQVEEVNRLHGDDPPPATPSGSPISFGKA